MQLLSVFDAARQLALSHWSIRKLIREGRLPSVRLNRKVLIEAPELQKLIEQSRRRAS